MLSIKLWQPANSHLNRVLHTILAVVSTAGLIDATYLTITHYTNRLVPCNFTHGCESVLKSQYSEVLGIPVAAFGVIFYLFVLVLSVYSALHRHYSWLITAAGLIGFGSTIYLTYLQYFVIGAWCQYCLFSALTSTVIFVVSMVLWILNRRLDKKDTKSSPSV